MPSPNQPSSSTIAYTRWKPVEGDEDQDDTRVEFHRFEEEDVSSPGEHRRYLSPLSTLTSSFISSSSAGRPPNLSRTNSRRRFNSGVFTVNNGEIPRSSVIGSSHHLEVSPRYNAKCWKFTIRIMGGLVIFGFGWIVGFLVRWSVHRYYVDTMGHCVTPLPYRYDPLLAGIIMDEVDSKSLRQFVDNFTAFDGHDVGSSQSAKFAQNIADSWRRFGFQQVEVNSINERVPVPSKEIPAEIVVTDWKGERVWGTRIYENRPDIGYVPYSASAIGEGHLVYGHLGRVSDFHDLKKAGLDFSNSVVMLKTNHRHHVGSMIRNAQLFGVKAVILFPDPVTKGDFSQLPRNASLSHCGKFVPGDPSSPYVTSSFGTRPRVPVASVSSDVAHVLLNFTNAQGVGKEFWFGLNLKTDSFKNFTASVSISRNVAKTTILNNVKAILPGKFEPTRYVIIGSHHDSSWHQGSGIAHSILMELARIFGRRNAHGWQPGRSLIFASWDGEEFGHLGSTSWLYGHEKELTSRGVVYINIDHSLQSVNTIQVAGSPLLKDVITVAAKSVSCAQTDVEDAERKDDACNEWLEETFGRTKTSGNESHVSFGYTPNFQNMIGVSSMGITLRSHRHTVNSLQEQIGRMDLNFDHTEKVTKFLVVILLQLLTSAQLPLNAESYASDIRREVKDFLLRHVDDLKSHGVAALDIRKAVDKFADFAKNFHSEYQPSPALEFLANHEFNDQLLELERSFLLPAFVSSDDDSLLQDKILSGPSFRHILYGPSPLNMAEIKFLPRLDAAIRIAKIEDTIASWNSVKHEAFFLVEALESALCVLDNHLVNPYEVIA